MCLGFVLLCHVLYVRLPLSSVLAGQKNVDSLWSSFLCAWFPFESVASCSSFICRRGGSFVACTEFFVISIAFVLLFSRLFCFSLAVPALWNGVSCFYWLCRQSAPCHCWQLSLAFTSLLQVFLILLCGQRCRFQHGSLCLFAMISSFCIARYSFTNVSSLHKSWHSYFICYDFLCLHSFFYGLLFVDVALTYIDGMRQLFFHCMRCLMCEVPPSQLLARFTCGFILTLLWFPPWFLIPYHLLELHVAPLFNNISWLHLSFK